MTANITQELDTLVTIELSKVASSLAEAVHVPTDPLQNLDLQTNNIQRELSQCMRLAKTRIRDGFMFCIRAVQELAKTDLSINLQALEQNVNRAFARFDSVASAKDMCSKVMEGTSWKELLGLSSESVDLLYRGAKDLFEKRHNPEAEAAFFFLSTIDYAQYAFWIGLGHAAFELGNLNQALNAYEMADTCQPGSIWPHIYMANCFEALRDFEESLICLEAALSELLDSPDKDQSLLAELKSRIMTARSKA